MKFGVAYVNAGPFGFPEQLVTLARTAEEVGFESLWSVEHVVIPVGYRSPYPYDATGKIPAPENAPIADPFLPLAFAAAITTRVRLGTAVVILPQRHPVYVAKEVATLDVLSQGRAMLGVGVGWLREEFETVGVPFAERGRRTDESIRAIRSLWQDEPEAFAGQFYRWGAVESNPKPVQKPGVPIIIGGHTRRALRRAARYGDGFMPASDDYHTVSTLFTHLREECAAIGRDAQTIELSAGSRRVDRDTVRRYEDLGVSRLVIAPPGFDAEAIRKGLHEFGDRVLAQR